LRDVARERASHDISGDRRRLGGRGGRWVGRLGLGWVGSVQSAGFSSVSCLKWTGLGERTGTAGLLSCHWARPSWRTRFPCCYPIITVDLAVPRSGSSVWNCKKKQKSEENYTA
jgi:hypothetical protein